jgi:hypothetical protein
MRWRCFFLRRGFVPYLEGEIAPRKAKSIESHLARCPECRELLARVCAGRVAARHLGREALGTGHHPPLFEELWEDIGARLTARHRQVWNVGNVLRSLSRPVTAQLLVVLVLALSVWLVVSYRISPMRPGVSLNTPDFRGFTPIRIAEFSSNNRSRVVTEGFVNGVYFDEEEKTLHIKLVEARHESAPFVICEVLNPSGIAIPREGSRVRVYGTARYDSQPGRGWNEVNPVTNIDVLKR